MVIPSVGLGNGLVAIKHLPEGTTTTIPCQIVSPGLSELKSEAHHNCKSHHEYREEFATVLSLIWKSQYLGKTVFILKRALVSPPDQGL